jgi:hypothetical protein
VTGAMIARTPAFLLLAVCADRVKEYATDISGDAGKWLQTTLTQIGSSLEGQYHEIVWLTPSGAAHVPPYRIPGHRCAHFLHCGSVAKRQCSP